MHPWHRLPPLTCPRNIQGALGASWEACSHQEPFKDKQFIKRGQPACRTPNNTQLANNRPPPPLLPGAALQASHVAQHEEGCSAYELSVSTDDPDSFIIYER